MKPIKLLLSVEAVKALYLAAEHVRYEELLVFEGHTLAALDDAAEVLKSAITVADEEALIASVQELTAAVKEGA